MFPGFLTQLFFPKPPTTFLTCFCRGEWRKYAGKKVRLDRGSNSQPPGHESDTLTTEPPGRGWAPKGKATTNSFKDWFVATGDRSLDLPLTRRTLLPLGHRGGLSQSERGCRRQIWIWWKWQKVSRRTESTVGKGEIARYEQLLLFPPGFQKACNADTTFVCERVKSINWPSTLNRQSDGVNFLRPLLCIWGKKTNINTRDSALLQNLHIVRLVV